MLRFLVDGLAAIDESTSMSGIAALPDNQGHLPNGDASSTPTAASPATTPRKLHLPAFASLRRQFKGDKGE